MPFQLFHDLVPDVAERETRTVTLLERSSHGLPPADYSLLEMFCNEPGCDCRRVFFSVASSRTENIDAVIAFGWETPDFYAKWMSDDDPDTIQAMMGPILNPGSPQSEDAPAILEMVRDYVLTDMVYVQRLKTHYEMFRRHIEVEHASGRTPKRRRKTRSRRRKRK